jgi:hypothetical protein
MAIRRIIDTTSQQFCINLYKGITYSKAFQWTDSNGVGIDLGGKSLVINFKNTFDSLLTLATDGSPTTLGSFFSITDEVNGNFRLQLSDEETATANTGAGSYWIEVHDGGNIDILWGPDTVEVFEL